MNKCPMIRECMTIDLITLSPDDEIVHAMMTLLGAKISGAPVVDEHGHLVGVLSKKDCLKAALNASYYQEWGGAVAEYMSKDVETLNGNLDVVQAAEAFLASSYRRFPILDDGVLIGQVSRSDILKALSEQWGSDIGAL